MFQCGWPTQTYIQTSFKNMFRQKRRNLHVFRHKVGPRHLFLQWCQCCGIHKPVKISLFTMFFSFLSVFPLAEAYQNDQKFHFNTLFSLDTQNLRKISQTPPDFGLGAKLFLLPPTGKAYIATAITTDVIEHLVWLFAPQ